LVNRLEVREIYPEVRGLTSSFVARQYGGQRPPDEAALASWRRIRLRLWLLGLYNRLRG
jgi:hypothetical protein